MNRMRPQRTLRRTSRGYALVDVSLAILLGTGIAAAGVASAIDGRGNDSARGQGLAMLTLQGAVNQYLTDYYGQLVQPGGGTVAGVAVPLAPTIAELRAVGALKDPLQNTAFNGGNYHVKISTFPAGCVAPNCNLDGLVWNDKPLVDWWNNIDYPRLGLAVRTIGADGAMSNAASANTLLGMQGKWSTVNPVGAQAGILAARTGYNSASFSQFYRRDGSLAMTNDVAAGGYNINNAKALNAQKVNLPNGNSVQVGSAYLYGDTLNMAVRSPSGNAFVQDNAGNNGTLYAAGAGITGAVNAGLVNATQVSGSNVSATSFNATTSQIWGNHYVYGGQYNYGPLVASNMVYLPALAWAGYGCGGNGITTDPTGALLSCQSGVWQQAGGSPSGTLCGSSQMGRSDWVGGHLCQGYDPWYSCPAGYSQVAIASIKGEQVNSCMKN